MDPKPQVQLLLTRRMRAVVEWLLAYPTVTIQAVSDVERPMWTTAWVSEEARQHMIAVSADLGIPISVDPRRGRPIDGPTPKLTTQTFRALLERGLIRAVARRVPREGWSDMYYYQLTPDGKMAAQFKAKPRSAA